MKTKASLILVAVILGIALYGLSLREPKNIEIETELNARKADPECNTSQNFLAKNCSEYLSTERVTREEWAILFPEATFDLVQRRTIENVETNMEGFVQDNFIIIRQGQREYKDDDFDALLHDNEIMISDENLELVLRAFAWISAANYFKNDLHFSALEEVSLAKGEARHAYNYHLSATVESEPHEELHWYFVIQDNELRIVTYLSSAPLKDYLFFP
jgi:hypothetical protein